MSADTRPTFDSPQPDMGSVKLDQKPNSSRMSRRGFFRTTLGAGGALLALQMFGGIANADGAGNSSVPKDGAKQPDVPIGNSTSEQLGEDTAYMPSTETAQADTLSQNILKRADRIAAPVFSQRPEDREDIARSGRIVQLLIAAGLETGGPFADTARFLQSHSQKSGNIITNDRLLSILYLSAPSDKSHPNYKLLQEGAPFIVIGFTTYDKDNFPDRLRQEYRAIPNGDKVSEIEENPTNFSVLFDMHVQMRYIQYSNEKISQLLTSDPEIYNNPQRMVEHIAEIDSKLQNREIAQDILARAYLDGFKGLPIAEQKGWKISDKFKDTANTVIDLVSSQGEEATLNYVKENIDSRFLTGKF